MITPLILAAACGSVCSNSYVVKQRVVAPYAAVQYAVAPVYYFVGASVRTEALVEKQKHADPEWQEFLEFKRFKAYSQQQQMQHVEQPPPEPAVQQGAIATMCAHCHGTATPKGSFFLDGKPGMKAEDVTDAIRQIAADKMPKDKVPLTKEEKNALLQDLLSLEYKDNPEELPPLPDTQGQ